jgi:hypothetical protein
MSTALIAHATSPTHAGISRAILGQACSEIPHRRERGACNPQHGGSLSHLNVSYSDDFPFIYLPVTTLITGLLTRTLYFSIIENPDVFVQESVSNSNSYTSSLTHRQSNAQIQRHCLGESCGKLSSGSCLLANKHYRTFLRGQGFE